MSDSLLAAILKIDDDAVIHHYDEESGAFEVSTDVDLEALGVLQKPLGAQIKNALVDNQLLERESRARVPDVHIRVFRAMCVSHAMFSATVMVLSYVVYYVLAYDARSREASLFVTLGGLLAMCVFLVCMAFSPRQTWLMFLFFTLFLWSWVALVGALSAYANTIVAIQCASMCFAQCLALYMYTLDAPQRLEKTYASLYLVLASTMVMACNVYGFIVLDALISALVLLTFAVCNGAYLVWQMVHATRYCMSVSDIRCAVFNVYLDPLTTVVARYKSATARAPPENDE